MTETRFVLVKPGDVLLIGNIGLRSAQEVTEAVELMRRTLDVRVLFFGADIDIDSLTAADIERLLEENRR